MVCVLDEGNIAVGIKGRGRVIKEDMKNIPWRITLVEIEVDEVKSDALAWVPIKHGLRFETGQQATDLDRKAFDELRESS